MRLVNIHTHRSIVAFEDKATRIFNKFLEREMKSMGIPIPPGMRGLYEGRDVVYLGDREFQRAFKEIYYITSMDSRIFKWQD